MQGGIAQVPVTCANGCERVTGTCANRKTPGILSDPGCLGYRYMNYLRKFAFTYPETPVFGTNTHT